jgi:hypothetical protein
MKQKFDEHRDTIFEICVVINCAIAAYEAYDTPQSPIVLLLVTMLLFK